MKIMRVLAIVGAAMAATAAAQATSIGDASVNPLVGKQHKVRYCTVYQCLQTPTAPAAQH